MRQVRWEFGPQVGRERWLVRLMVGSHVDREHYSRVWMTRARLGQLLVVGVQDRTKGLPFVPQVIRRSISFVGGIWLDSSWFGISGEKSDWRASFCRWNSILVRLGLMGQGSILRRQLIVTATGAA